MRRLSVASNDHDFLMLIPTYWAEARTRVRRPGARHEKVIRRWGWAEESQAAAELHAQARVEAAKDVFLSGETVAHREAQHEYPVGSELPIREEVVQRIGPNVVTRNGYGALCLNTPDVLFADIDDPLPPGQPRAWALLGWGLLFFAVLCLLQRASFGPLAMGVWAGYFLGQRIYWNRVAQRFSGRDQSWHRVNEFIARNPDWHLRVYETPRGLRALAMHRTFNPAEAETAQALGALSNDALFQRLCAQQGCFRARVSPKPWRVPGMGSLRPPRRLWPLSGEKLDEHRGWVARYEAACEGFAACKFIKSLGATEKSCPQTQVVQALHDGLSHATKELALA